YGMPGVLIDGNDAAMVHVAVTEAIERARSGGGPTLIEALTYRIEAHTNADDATRYRQDAEVAEWLARDPISRLQTYLTGAGLLDEAAVAAIAEEGEDRAGRLRAAMNADPVTDPAEMFAHVYTEPTAALRKQAAGLADEIADSASQEAS
ncbi:MAG: pyruvate dehydrogenase (acetyl-transferring) E1 component subunit alpha, partial [Actinobacteria bacterium]|nr:pyruvate dehydrogenase (acetyl-transferring) E1 component subunit alpha [Actinomycetota bacterium]